MQFYITILLTLCTFSAYAAPVDIAYYFPLYGGSPADVITGSGFNPIPITNFNTFDLSSVSVLIVENSGLASRATELEEFVSGGGVLVVSDPNAAPPAALLFPFTAVFQGTTDVDPFAGTAMQNGPAGVLDNASLDGGDWSAHGYVDFASLPMGAETYLYMGGDTSKIVDFSYAYGNGTVFYSTIPYGCYLPGGLCAPSAPGVSPLYSNAPALRDIYVPNLLNLAADSVSAPVPESASSILLGAGLIGLALVRRRR